MSSSAREAHNAFIRWQAVRIEHFGHVVNLVLTLSTATLGFAVSLAIERKITPGTYGSYLFDASLVILLFAVGAGLLTNWTRLCDYRYTARAVRGRELHERIKAGELLDEKDWGKSAKRKWYSDSAEKYGERSWCFLKIQLLLFVFGVLLLAAAVALHYWSIQHATVWPCELCV